MARTTSDERRTTKKDDAPRATRLAPSIQWILFSKERPLQAKSCIRSMLALSDVRSQDITVLYVDSDAVSYEQLAREYACNFVRQQSFLKDVAGIVTVSPAAFIGFLVDDLIFRAPFSAADMAGILQQRSDIDCFSLRMGRNIICAPAPQLQELAPGMLFWQTQPGLGKHWNYVWELSSSVYRRDHVLKYFKRCSSARMHFPNPLEYLYYGIMPNCYTEYGSGIRLRLKRLWWQLACPRACTHRIGCCETSRAFTQGINMVAERGREYDAWLSPERLYELFLEGCVIDYECLRDIENTAPNAGRAHFRLLAADGSVHPDSVYK